MVILSTIGGFMIFGITIIIVIIWVIVEIIFVSGSINAGTDFKPIK